MTKMADRVRSLRARRSEARRGQGRDELADLRSRLSELEEEVLENRQLARRIAELTDTVEQLLLSEPQRTELAAERRRHSRPEG